MRRILLIIDRPARERIPMNTGDSAVFSRKGFQYSIPFIISLVRVKMLLYISTKKHSLSPCLLRILG